jgi:hypothetical protein
MSYTHPEDNEGILLQPSIWEGQNEYTNEFSSSDYERAEYSPQLEVFWTSNESYPDHVPFKYFEYSNVDYVETKVLIDRYEDLESGRLYAILGALNTINGDQCLRLYSKQIQVGDYVYKVNEDMEILDSYRITRGRNFNYLPFPEGSASKICETVEVDPEIPYCDGWNMFQAHLNDDPDTPQFEVCMFMIPLAD